MAKISDKLRIKVVLTLNIGLWTAIKIRIAGKRVADELIAEIRNQFAKTSEVE